MQYWSRVLIFLVMGLSPYNKSLSGIIIAEGRRIPTLGYLSGSYMKKF